MNTQNFFLKFDKALHWFLPLDEAQDVLTEYRDMQQQAASSGDELFRPNEKPWKIASTLKNPQEYYRWLLVFVLLLLGPLLSLAYTLNLLFVQNAWWSTPAVTSRFLFWLSLPLAFFWAHHSKRRPDEPKRQPKLLAAAAALLLFNAAGAGFAIYWYIQTCLGNCPWLTGVFISSYISFFVIVNALICLFSLMNCRLRSRRWLGIYLIGILLLLGAMYYMEIITNMSLVAPALNTGVTALHFYYLPLACGLAASLKILW